MKMMAMKEEMFTVLHRSTIETGGMACQQGYEEGTREHTESRQRGESRGRESSLWFLREGMGKAR